MQFHSIKYSEKTGVHLKWTTTDNGNTVTHELPAKEKPMTPFLAALAAFRPFVIDTLSLPAKWADPIIVTGIALSESKNGQQQLQVFTRRPIPKAANAPAFINTPLMRAADDDEGEAAGTYGEDVQEKIDALVEASVAYINGEREQLELMPDAPVAVEGDDDVAELRAEKARGKTRGKKKGAESSTSADEQIRADLLTVGRDVPVDAISAWSSSERDEVVRWMHEVDQAKQGLRDETKIRKEPKVLKLSATPALLEEQLVGTGATDA